MKIGNVQFKNNLILAPMAGVSDVAFRSLAVSFGADASVTEMISAKALSYNNEKTKDLLFTAPNEKIKIVQLFGHEPEIMAKMCTSNEIEKFDIIDINMGCPAPKIVNNGDGSALMLDINKAKDIIIACVNATRKPITVKFRSGFDNEHINAVEFAKMCEEAGAKAITIHARTRAQMYSGKADLDIAKAVKNAVKIPVIVSGDVVDKNSYNLIKNYTGCDAIMIGRGALGNPEIFAEILGKKIDVSKYDIIKNHIENLRKYYSDNFVQGHIRKHILWYLKGYPNAGEIKQYVSIEPDINNVLNCLKEFLKDFD